MSAWLFSCLECFGFFFNLWINIFHRNVWLHASSVHPLSLSFFFFFFFFTPVHLFSLALCDDVMMMSSSSQLIWPFSVKLFHCRNVHLNKHNHFLVSFLLQYYFSVQQQQDWRFTNNPAHFKYYLLKCCGIYFRFTLLFTLAVDAKELWEGSTRNGCFCTVGREL